MLFYNSSVQVSDFDYNLPDQLIAQEALEDRAASRLLHLRRPDGQCDDLAFRDLPRLLRPDDVLVLNDTRVFPARLLGRRSGARAQALSPNNPASREFLQGQVEVLLTRQLSDDPHRWECLVRPGRKIGVGERLYFGEGPELEAQVVSRGSFGERAIEFAPSPDFFAALERAGHVPLPPYIARSDGPADQLRYQTVYARQRGSIAAPTAGLHFTPEILAAIRLRGVDITHITLHVGLGTFQPVRVEQVEQHRLHGERYAISEEAAETIRRAQSLGRRIVAVGTTTVRTLEFAAAANGGEIKAGNGEADLFIYPGFQFRVTGALLTNFHLPRSTLLMLVCAFGGRENVLAAYRHAVEREYRFYSYGDCMFLE